MLTKDDINKIQFLITAGSNRVIKEIDEVKEEIREVKEQVKFLPTREEYFDSMDKLMGEVKKVREEQEVIGGKLSEHSDRLEKVKKKWELHPFADILQIWT